VRVKRVLLLVVKEKLPSMRFGPLLRVSVRSLRPTSCIGALKVMVMVVTDAVRGFGETAVMAAVGAGAGS
jgi:hypothetical protein